MFGWVAYRRRHVKKFGHGKEFHGLRFFPLPRFLLLHFICNFSQISISATVVSLTPFKTSRIGAQGN